MARLEMEAMARSYGLNRKTHFLNVLDAAGISKTQKDRGEKRADGGGYELVLEVPLFDFGRANVREAEHRYLEAANRLGQMGVNAASEAREAYGTYRATYAIARKHEGEVLPLHQTISAETELQYNAMQVDAFALLEAARARAKAKLQASKRSGTSGSPPRILVWPCLVAEVSLPSPTRCLRPRAAARTRQG
jgi:outer membrane protein TolC